MTTPTKFLPLRGRTMAGMSAGSVALVVTEGIEVPSWDCTN